jgi:hypothetical protein
VRQRDLLARGDRLVFVLAAPLQLRLEGLALGAWQRPVPLPGSRE